MEQLSQRAARGVALAALATACVLVGPAPRLIETLERTYLVAVVDAQREARRRRHHVSPLAWRRRRRPRPTHPGHVRP